MKKFNFIILLFLIVWVMACSKPGVIRPVYIEDIPHKKKTEDSIKKKPEEKFEKDHHPQKDILTLPSEVVVHDGKIKLKKSVLEELYELDGPVFSVFHADSKLYYLRVKDEDSALDERRRNSTLAGCIDLYSNKILYEKNLPVDVFGPGTKRFFVSGNTVSVLCFNGILYSIDLLSMDVKVKQGVLDLARVDGKFLFLESNESGIKLIFNEESLSLAIRGDLKIEKILHNRLVSVSNADNIETIDLVQMKSLTIYSLNKKYSRPDPHNIIITMTDKREAYSDRDMIYFRVYVDGFERGRTGTGPSAKELRIFLTVKTNDHHLIRLERWKLNRRKNMYERENNVSQPDVMRIKIEENRVLLVSGSYDGKNYSFKTSLAVE